MDIDKYKLLISESDMILGLLLKHSNKLAYINNLISLSRLNEQISPTLQQQQQKQSYFNFYLLSSTAIDLSTTATFTLSKSQIEIHNQEINKIQRKKDETLYLKQGIDKRAISVKEFLKKYVFISSSSISF